MGATALTALNILAMPCSLGNDVVAEIMRGGSDKVREAGAFVVGGHSVDDKEPKYGLSVFGTIHPDKVIRNKGVCAGDKLYYTTGLGSGIMNSAYRAGLETEESMRPVIDSMMELNKLPAEAMIAAKAHAATDVTGFGLAGHLHEMLEPSGVAAKLYWDNLPLFDGVWEYSVSGCRPGRTFSIMDWARDFIRKGTMDDATYDNRMGILCDPQTSGGLLVSIAPDQAEVFEREFEARMNRKPALIGEAMDGPAGMIFVR